MKKPDVLHAEKKLTVALEKGEASAQECGWICADQVEIGLGIRTVEEEENLETRECRKQI